MYKNALFLLKSCKNRPYAGGTYPPIVISPKLWIPGYVTVYKYCIYKIYLFTYNYAECFRQCIMRFSKHLKNNKFLINKLYKFKTHFFCSHLNSNDNNSSKNESWQLIMNNKVLQEVLQAVNIVHLITLQFLQLIVSSRCCHLSLDVYRKKWFLNLYNLFIRNYYFFRYFKMGKMHCQKRSA